MTVGDPRDFREYLLQWAPTFARGPVASRLWGWLGLHWDAITDGAQLAVLARFVASPSRPPDALALLGAERVLPRYPGEGDAAYGLRVFHAWRTWRRAGTLPLITEQLQTAVGAVFAPAWWGDTWDGDTKGGWSRLYLRAAFGAHPWQAEGTWDDGQVWDDGGVWDLNATRAQVDAMRQIVDEYRAGHIRVHLVVQTGEAMTPRQVWGTVRVNHEPDANMALLVPGLTVYQAERPLRLISAAPVDPGDPAGHWDLQVEANQPVSDAVWELQNLGITRWLRIPGVPVGTYGNPGATTTLPAGSYLNFAGGWGMAPADPDGTWDRWDNRSPVYAYLTG